MDCPSELGSNDWHPFGHTSTIHVISKDCALNTTAIQHQYLAILLLGNSPHFSVVVCLFFLFSLKSITIRQLGTNIYIYTMVCITSCTVFFPNIFMCFWDLLLLWNGTIQELFSSLMNEQSFFLSFLFLHLVLYQHSYNLEACIIFLTFLPATGYPVMIMCN